MSRRYLVTGGTGFLGSSIVKRLVDAGHFVRSLDDNSRGAVRRLGNYLRTVELVEADVRNADAARRAIKGMDTVIHMAFVNGTEFFYSKPELVLDVAIKGMLNVLEGCRSENVGDLIVASSAEVYQSPPVVPTDETAPFSIPDPLNPRYSYGGGKIINELMAINYGRTGFDRVTIFRPHNVYGPDMGWEHVLPQLIVQMVRKVKEVGRVESLPIEIQGDGRQTRAFLHVDDFAQGLMCVINGGQHLNIYHIGNPEEVTIRDVVDKIAKYFGREVKIIVGEEAAGSTRRRCPDISKLVRLGYHPRISLEMGLPSIADWYTEHFEEEPSRMVNQVLF